MINRNILKEPSGRIGRLSMFELGWEKILDLRRIIDEHAVCHQFISFVPIWRSRKLMGIHKEKSAILSGRMSIFSFKKPIQPLFVYWK
jgi:hypothetical protein